MSNKKIAISKPKRNSRTSSGTLYHAEKEKSSENLSHRAKQKRRTGDMEMDESSEAEDINVKDNGEITEEEAENYPEEQPKRSTSPKQQQRPSGSERKKESSSSKTSLRNTLLVIGVIVLCGAYLFGNDIFPNGISDSSSNDPDWRSKVDPNNSLSNNQQNIIRASLKPILDKSSTRDEGVSTLLILSSDEESAAKLARCLLKLVNKKTNKDQISTEINLQSHRGGKSALDSNLRTLLDTTNTVRSVLLRRIDNIPSSDTLEQLRLLFAYCDGENPVIPHRLIIMTATSTNEHESELREEFKNRLPNEHDFVDALMSRISGHTLYVKKEQTSIC